MGDVPYASTNGICWKAQALTPALTNGLGLSGIAYGNGRFVAVAPGTTGPGAAYISTDGFSWQRAADLPASSQTILFERISFGGGLFMLPRNYPHDSVPGPDWVVMTSPDGITWGSHPGPTNGQNYFLTGSAYGNGTYALLGWYRTLPEGSAGVVLLSSHRPSCPRPPGPMSSPFLPFRIIPDPSPSMILPQSAPNDSIVW